MTNTFQKNFIAEIKEKVRQAQYEALKVVNVHLINLYWEIGKSISEKQAESWGKGYCPNFIKRIAEGIPRS